MKAFLCLYCNAVTFCLRIYITYHLRVENFYQAAQSVSLFIIMVSEFSFLRRRECNIPRDLVSVFNVRRVIFWQIPIFSYFLNQFYYQVSVSGHSSTWSNFLEIGARTNECCACLPKSPTKETRILGPTDSIVWRATETEAPAGCPLNPASLGNLFVSVMSVSQGSKMLRAEHFHLVSVR